jgi:large subunit ribosomal protein L29
MLTLEDIRQMDPQSINAEIAKTQHELLKMKLQTASGQSKETSQIKALRKTIARLQTVQKEFKLSANK